MIYYVSKVFWLVAAPTRGLVLISAIAALWAELGSSKCAAAAAACGLVIGAFTPIGVALIVPLKHRFQFSPPDLQAPDGIILLAGSGSSGIDTVSVLSQDYPKARLIFSGFSATDRTVLKKFARLGGDPARVYMPVRTTDDFRGRTVFRCVAPAKAQRKVVAGHLSLAHAARCRMLSDCWISGEAVSGRI
jgi:hypothetical protein